MRLLASLAHQKDAAAQERDRQLAIAHLKRDERRARRGKKLNEVALIIQGSQEDEKRRENM